MGALLDRLDREGGHVDLALGIAMLVLAGFGATVSPVVAQAAGEGWIAVFLATLAWSLGCAIAAGVVTTKIRAGESFLGAESLVVVSGSLVLAWAFAAVVGIGVLQIDASAGENFAGPLQVVGIFLTAAVLTYGPVGALLSALVGVWLGVRVAQHASA